MTLPLIRNIQRPPRRIEHEVSLDELYDGVALASGP
jgi:hypothetical protein